MAYNVTVLSVLRIIVQLIQLFFLRKIPVVLITRTGVIMFELDTRSRKPIYEQHYYCNNELRRISPVKW